MMRTVLAGLSGLVLLLLMAFACPDAMNAQTVSAPAWDVAVTYSAANANHVTGQQFWAQGGAAEVQAQLYRGFGVVARVTGLHSGSSQPATVASLDLITTTFGLRYTLARGRRLQLFGEALGGEAEGFNSLFAKGSGPANGTTDSSNSLAFEAGGGLDLRLSRHFALRAAQIDYLRTQFPNGGTNVQDNLRLAAGLVWRPGRGR
jgi:outer membrane immunogenic protein